MNFSTGNSGNSLREAVIKTGPGCQQEGAFCQFLGRDIAPEVYALIPDGYIMEALKPATLRTGTLWEIEYSLDVLVWNRPALPISMEQPWQDYLSEFGITAPEGVIVTDPCLVHGDPTASNVLWRQPTDSASDTKLILADPRPPRAFIPQHRETDMGRILQSYMGWEVAAYGAKPINFIKPAFFRDKDLMRAATFWCGAAAARIEFLEKRRTDRPKRERILNWCANVRTLCNV